VVLLGFAGVAGAQDPLDVGQPSSSGLPGGDFILKLINWTRWLALAGCLLATAGGGVIYALAQHQSRADGAGRGVKMVLGGLIGAAVIGLGPTMINTMFAS